MTTKRDDAVADLVRAAREVVGWDSYIESETGKGRVEFKNLREAIDAVEALGSEAPAPLVLRFDASRLTVEPSGVLIRALAVDVMVTSDAAYLDRESMLAWLRSRGDLGREGEARWLRSIVLALLQYESEAP